MSGVRYPGGFYPGDTPQVLSAALSASSIASGEAWGAPSVDSAVTLAPSSIPSDEAWGAPTLTTSATLSGFSIDSSEAWGAPTIIAAQILAAASIDSSEAWGTPVAHGAAPAAVATPGFYPAGFYPGARYEFVAAGILGADSIPSGEAWGAPTLTFAVALSPSSIASSEAWGVPAMALQHAAAELGNAYPGGFYPGSVAYTSTTGALAAASIASGEAWGAPTLASTTILAAASIPSSEAWGVPGGSVPGLRILRRQYAGGFYPGFAPAGDRVLFIEGIASIDSSEAWGAPAVLYAQALGMDSIASGEAWGVPVVIASLSATYSPAIHARPTGIGCGSYQVMIFDRGKRTANLVKVEPASVDWSRLLDKTSKAGCVVGGLSKLSCCRELVLTRPRQHELGVFRDGRRVWIGAVTLFEVDGEEATIEASDLSYWLSRRFIHADHSWPVDAITGLPLTDLAVMFNALGEDAMSVDNSPGLVFNATPCGVLGAREVLASEHAYAIQHIDELSSTGIDWTMVDAELRAGGAAVPTDPVAILDDSAFATPPRVTFSDDRGGTRIAVAGSGSGVGLDPVYGEYGPGDAAYAALVAKYGVAEELVQASTINDSTSAAAAARTRWDLLKEPIAVLDSGTLSPFAPITQEQLVAGALVEVRLSGLCVPVLTKYRLGSVNAQATPDGEKINVTFQPVGTLAAA